MKIVRKLTKIEKSNKTAKNLETRSHFSDPCITIFDDGEKFEIY
jgi:hypothetical protein